MQQWTKGSLTVACRYSTSCSIVTCEYKYPFAQEDSGNIYGEHIFITNALAHNGTLVT